MNEKEIRYFSMFTGVGGFELGLENKGSESSLSGGWKENSSISQDILRQGDQSSTTKFSCVGFSEIDKYASELLAKRFPNTTNFGDATKINPTELPDFDLLCGGFPCQSFSIAGKRKGFKDTRGTMFFEIARILEVKRPKLVLLENVKGLLNHDKGETFSTIIQAMEELGYRTQWMVLNSKFFGVPQNRERVFILGSARGTSRPEILPFRETIKEVNGEDKMIWYGRDVRTGKDGKNPLQEAHRVYDTSGIIQTVKQTPLKINMIQGDVSGKGHKSQQDRVYMGDGVMACLPSSRTEDKVKILDVYNKKMREECPTLSDPCHNNIRLAISNKSAREFKWQTERSPTLQARDYKDPKIVLQGSKIRRLTPTECERLQSFPDGWTEGFSDTQRYKMMGNAVTVNVIKAISEKLLEVKK